MDHFLKEKKNGLYFIEKTNGLVFYINCLRNVTSISGYQYNQRINDVQFALNKDDGFAYLKGKSTSMIYP